MRDVVEGDHCVRLQDGQRGRYDRHAESRRRAQGRTDRHRRQTEQEVGDGQRQHEEGRPVLAKTPVARDDDDRQRVQHAVDDDDGDDDQRAQIRRLLHRHRTVAAIEPMYADGETDDGSSHHHFDQSNDSLPEGTQLTPVRSG